VVRVPEEIAKVNREFERRLPIFGEFREFIARGSVIDLAVGVIIGAAFNDVVKSLVDQVVMPPIGLALSGVDFSRMEWVLKPDNPATKQNELVAIQYGAFLNVMIRFVIVSWVVFLLVKTVNIIRRRQAEQRGEPENAPSQEMLLTEIRDLLKVRAEHDDRPTRH
jgi:large conductance mechanosensitive channel